MDPIQNRVEMASSRWTEKRLVNGSFPPMSRYPYVKVSLHIKAFYRYIARGLQLPLQVFSSVARNPKHGRIPRLWLRPLFLTELACSNEH